MNVKELCEKADISTRYWSYLLSADRNAGPAKAKTISKILSVDKGLFIFGTAKQRRAAWEKFLKSQKRNR